MIQGRDSASKCAYRVTERSGRPRCEHPPYDWIDLEAAITLGKPRYYAVLLGVMKAILSDEGAARDIAKVDLKAFLFTGRQWEEA